MKKLLNIVMTLTLALCLCSTAFAAPSKTYTAEFSGATDSTGKTVEATIAEVPAAEKLSASVALSTLESGAKAEANNDAAVLSQFDVSVPSGTAFPVTLTFSVPGVTSGMNIELLHYNATVGGWEIISTTVGDGVVSGVFNSLSPVAVVMVENSATAATSPKTGETNFVLPAGAAIIASCGVMYVLTRKKTA